MFRPLASVLPTIVLLATVGLAPVSPAQGQSRDGAAFPDQPASVDPGARTLQALTCTTVTLRTLRSQNAQFTTSSTGFVTIPGAVSSVTVGGSRCIKVLFTAETACGISGARDICYLRAIVNGNPMNPLDSFRAADSEHFLAGARAYEWFRGIPVGTHTVAIQARVANTATEFVIDDWTLDVEVSNVP